ncbi:MAG: DUF3365 domain-containing protein [Sphingomonadaceae bacterium]|nr:DUF3365 domain-containing protein [Sphingomonadaceae bacterium]
MIRQTILFAPLLLAGCGQTAPEAEVAPPAPINEAMVTARSMAVAEAFQGQLQAQLKDALRAGGPMQAVTVCSQVAPAIAAQQSDASGAVVHRVSDRNRNPGASLDDNVQPYYEQLAAAPMDGDKPAHRIWRSGEGAQARINYLSAIPMKEEPCSLCHGTNVSPGLQEHIRRLYNGDKATGFIPGELRGALHISWPAEAFDEAYKAQGDDAG